MNHPGIDPSLRAAEPPLDSLADGFSPAAQPSEEQPQDAQAAPDDLALAPKSPF